MRHIAAVPYAELAAELALGVTADAVRAALIELRDDGFFPGKPQLDETQFSGTLRAVMCALLPPCSTDRLLRREWVVK